MTSKKDRRFRPIGRVGFMLASILLSSCQQLGSLGGTGCADNESCANKAKVCEKPTVRALAHDLDDLEDHIEKFGSVVAKQPDVWGQARLTAHRQEFEQQMALELSGFTNTLQGSVTGSDQAYFMDAFALSAAAGGPGASATAGSDKSSSAPSAVSAASTPTKGVSVSISNTTSTPSSQSQQSQQSSQSAASAIPSDVSGAFSNISRTPVQAPPALEFAAGKTGITLEPTIYLAEKARYLNCLHELRRINEGDDTADSPGYSLNLVRIPVSVLPGKRTAVGHGAEISMTLTPYLSDELLPTTFRNLVENDVVEKTGDGSYQLANWEEYRLR